MKASGYVAMPSSRHGPLIRAASDRLVGNLCRGRWWWLALVIICLRCDLLAAQSVTGRVLDAQSGGPLSGATVEMLSTDTVRIRATLTDSAGGFSLARADGRAVILRARMVGYGASFSDLIQGDSPEIEFRLEVRPLELEGITASTDGRCGAVEKDGGRTARLWDRIEATLDAVGIAGREALLELELLRFSRILAPTRRLLYEERVEMWKGAEAFQSAPPAILLDGGFVQAHGGELHYYLPTPEVVISRDFLEGHCFHAQNGPPGRSRLLGLGFRPREDRTAGRIEIEGAPDVLGLLQRASTGILDPRGVDVEGTIWVEPISGDLKSLDFRYVGLDLPAQSGGAGGYLGFERLPNGLWAVTRWLLWMPNLEVSRDGKSYEVVGVREEGGQVVTAVGALGRPFPIAGEIHLSGHVVSSAGEPVPGAVVRLSGTRAISVTNVAGEWSLRGVARGPHLLTARMPYLDSLALPHPAQRLNVETHEAGLRLDLPTRRAALQAVCPDLRQQEAHLLVVVHGLNADVRAEVRLADMAGNESERITDGAGRARFCGVPRNETLKLEVRWPGGERVITLDGIESQIGVVAVVEGDGS